MIILVNGHVFRIQNDTFFEG